VLDVHVLVGAPVRAAAALAVVAALTFMTVMVGDDRLAGAGLLDRPARGVDAAVVEAAQQDQILSGRRPAISPVERNAFTSYVTAARSRGSLQWSRYRHAQSQCPAGWVCERSEPRNHLICPASSNSCTLDRSTLRDALALVYCLGKGPHPPNSAPRIGRQVRQGCCGVRSDLQAVPPVES
jgi:hypothetical protein